MGTIGENDGGSRSGRLGGIDLMGGFKHFETGAADLDGFFWVGAGPADGVEPEVGAAAGAFSGEGEG